jgi:uncharacterized protein YecA (UPF0149 family)
VKQTHENAHIYDDVKKMSQPRRTMSLESTTAPQKVKQFGKVGRNKPCPCGSGLKYKNSMGAEGKTPLLSQVTENSSFLYIYMV